MTSFLFLIDRYKNSTFIDLILFLSLYTFFFI